MKYKDLSLEDFEIVALSKFATYRKSMSLEDAGLAMAEFVCTHASDEYWRNFLVGCSQTNPLMALELASRRPVMTIETLNMPTNRLEVQ